VTASARVLLLLALLAGVVPIAGAEQSMTREQRKQAAEINAQLAITYLKQGDLASARDKIDRALEQDPKTADTQMVAGFVYDRLGEDRKAQGHFEEAVKLAGKDNPDVLNNAAVFECRKGDKKRGVEYFLRAAESPLYRTPEAAYTNAGHCARANGDAKDAERYFRQALAIKPNAADPLLQMASLQFDNGNALQARAFLQRYQDVAPATAGSLWLGYRIENSLGDSAAASEYARKLRKDFPTSVEADELFQSERAKP